MLQPFSRYCVCRNVFYHLRDESNPAVADVACAGIIRINYIRVDGIHNPESVDWIDRKN